MRAGRERGALAIVLHTHMPYVEGFGTWPFGEEWLWEAMAGSYLPLLELLDAGAPLTLSLTPVLCDQLEAPGVYERFATFVEQVRRRTHEQDASGLRSAGHELLARELERSWGDYEGALEALARREGDLLGAFSPHAQWTSSATHAVLPLLASDAGVRLQVRTGVAAHRERFGDRWRGGFWLPECAHEERIEPLLGDAGVSAVCVELTGRFGLGAREHLRPLLGESGVVLVPIDRATISLVWSDGGYPADGAYRDYHHHTVHHHNPWSNDGGAYDHARAMRSGARARRGLRRQDDRAPARGRRRPAGRRAGRIRRRTPSCSATGGMRASPGSKRSSRSAPARGLELLRLDDALERLEPAPWRPDRAPEPSSWGQDGDLSTWSGPAVAEMAFATRAAELEVLAAGPRAGKAAVRELLALQASDWAFMVSRGIAAPYARERFAGHRLALTRALAEGADSRADGARNIAPHADRAALFGS